MIISTGVISPMHTIIINDSYERNFVVAFQDSVDLLINENEDWKNQGWPGNGTESNPYLVENVILTTFIIDGSDIYFVIQNCTWSVPAYLESVENGKIKDSNSNSFLGISNCRKITLTNLSITLEYTTSDRCISVDFSDDIKIVGCRIQGTEYGLFVSDSIRSQVENCSFTGCGIAVEVVEALSREKASEFQFTTNTLSSWQSYLGAGLWMDYCTESLIVNNSFYDNIGHGCCILRSESIKVLDNTDDRNGNIVSLHYSNEIEFSYNILTTGLSMYSCYNCTIWQNELGLGGLNLDGMDMYSYIHNISSNTILGKPLLYIVNESKTIYSNDEYGQVYIVNSSEITLNIIEVNLLDPSINILYSDLSKVIDSTSHSIMIYSSAYSTVQQSTINGGSIGISCTYSPSTIISSNLIEQTERGIHVSVGSDLTSIYNNTLENVGDHGIQITSSECQIINNTITGSATPDFNAHWGITTNYAGIRISGNECLVVNNSVINNHGYGIWITGARNTIYQNMLVANALGNGLSSGSDNQWDNGIDTGNYWDDWTGIGSYNVSGNEGCIDRYPIGGQANETTTTTNRTSWFSSPVTLILISISAVSIIVIIAMVIKIGKFKVKLK